MTAVPGPAESAPDAQVHTDSATLLGIGGRQIDLTEALTAGHLSLSGDPAVLRALLDGLSTVIAESD
ncbi:SCP2 sterol-binding domain-containing protein [Nocardia sp. BSTN01]|uniref:SCP2 sterol-binding domain-containing protein n=1 Tax=Nocardia sp. BSTN01 TaxID=2783665 RepID=UPI00188F8BB4|nr:SCP2 sterol-binding domain-containing protein [Nocardia sp. BSTN01]MBF4999955.1 SCP2 sterol-binding domain-containing protein [Nocardia sp. BSTN01]